MTRDDALLFLGLPPNASSEEEIKRAFAAKTAQWHPDLHKSDPSKNDVMRKLIEARDVALGKTAPSKEQPAPQEQDEEECDLQDEIRYTAEYLAFIGADFFGTGMPRTSGKPCRAHTKSGTPCSARAKEGNYGFCSRHR